MIRAFKKTFRVPGAHSQVWWRSRPRWRPLRGVIALASRVTLVGSMRATHAVVSAPVASNVDLNRKPVSKRAPIAVAPGSGISPISGVVAPGDGGLPTNVPPGMGRSVLLSRVPAWNHWNGESDERREASIADRCARRASRHRAAGDDNGRHDVAARHANSRRHGAATTPRGWWGAGPRRRSIDRRRHGSRPGRPYPEGPEQRPLPSPRQRRPRLVRPRRHERSGSERGVRGRTPDGSRRQDGRKGCRPNAGRGSMLADGGHLVTGRRRPRPRAGRSPSVSCCRWTSTYAAGGLRTRASASSARSRGSAQEHPSAAVRNTR